MRGEHGIRKIEALTRSHSGKSVAVLVDGELRSMPRVFFPITGDVQLNGLFTLEEAARMIQEVANIAAPAVSLRSTAG